ncbi:MAG: bifunctional 2-polyprenyl-6-hydroxyphenol methylase/3-demethylubiquinol 3-O-methyltransferase UbiG [Candidatus Melainabacteria bacterium]|jgi:2-polyprenyl-6-hydroxyphenyl methylase/3-demethylubiquinone-9 3-methyltransferase
MNVNNKFYDSLGSDWWEANDHMIVFLRAESKIKLEYLKQNITDLNKLNILDLGSGAGFIAIPLAEMGARVTALDYSQESLDILLHKANQYGVKDKIQTVKANLLDLQQMKDKLGEQKFDLVLAFDVLEHVTNPKLLVENAASFMKPEGQFAYHTLNRSLWCWLLYLQIVPRLIAEDPGYVHRHEFNIKPQEMNQYLEDTNLESNLQIGMRAPFFQKAVWELITKRKLESEMIFEFTKDLSLGYLGLASNIDLANK